MSKTEPETFFFYFYWWLGFPGGSDGKESAAV